MKKTADFPELERNLIAILRGVKPDEVLEIGQAVFEAGIAAIEVPLNSPDPFKSIERLATHLPRALVGAGTVLTPENVDELSDKGGRLMVSPNVDDSVMERAAHHELMTMPGVFTPSEGFLDFADYAASGVRAFGLGSSLYRPGNSADAVGKKAQAAVVAWDTVFGGDT